MRLADRVALVTGAGRGIGRSVAETFAREGATVVIAELSSEEGQRVEANIRELGGNAHFIATDVADPESVRQVVGFVERQFGRLHVLVNNAGLSQFSPVDQLSVETWDRILNVNLRGPFLCAQTAAPLMKRSGGGSIINMASTRALMSEPGNEAYAASKGGMLALTHALANSLGPDIRVNAICPGWIDVADSPLKPEDHLQHPVGRVGRPEDIANACVFLATDDSSFMTGQRLVIDGGMTIKMIYEE